MFCSGTHELVVLGLDVARIFTVPEKSPGRYQFYGRSRAPCSGGMVLCVRKQGRRPEEMQEVSPDMVLQRRVSAQQAP